MNKKKYTIIYNECIRSFITKMDRIETDDLNKLIEDEYGCSIWFVFEGHPQLEGEKAEGEKEIIHFKPIERTFICDFGDILSFARTLGYTWNQAHEILMTANLYQGTVSRNMLPHIVEDIEDDSYKIMNQFFNHYNIDEIYIKPKNVD